MSNIKCLLTIVILACFACSALAIRCYQCDSLSNPKCGGMFESEDDMRFDCATNDLNRIIQIIPGIRQLPRDIEATGCMKRTLENNGRPVIERTCFFGDIDNTTTGCQIDITLMHFNNQTSCDVCTGDWCNSSLSMDPIALTIVAFFALAHLFS